MKVQTLTTDETLRSTYHYGTDEFPFAYYSDDLTQYKGQCIEWHWHAELEFSLVIQGTVECFIGSEAINLHTGDGIFINSGTIHRFFSDTNGKMVNILFASDFISENRSDIYRNYVAPFLQSNLTHFTLSSSDVQHYEVLNHIKKILSVVSTESETRQLDIKIAVLLLWHSFWIINAKVITPAGHTSQKLLQARLQTMLNFIYQSYTQTLNLEDIAASAGISKTEALRCFHNGLQTTPIHFLNEYRLNQAAKLLQTTTDSITHIAFAVGYDNSGYFCKAFRKHYGMSPKEYRSIK